ncbi:hypothetical protein BKA56DRAFT_665801 [Ilyonectria sp. MPI-CAGE-AT-0026]|nr:hypothetical protein BKA56DRAFT_665801 [Ilyonectria sp. MPI-CAGE-AT-0026]
MKFTIICLATLAAPALAKFCGVVTSARSGWETCESAQFPSMQAACKAIGGTVGGSISEPMGKGANCVVYCNNVATGGHDVTAKISGRTITYRLLVEETCDKCSYCGGN